MQTLSMWAEYNAMVAQNLQAILVRVPVNRIMTSPPPPPPPVAHLAGHGGWSFGAILNLDYSAATHIITIKSCSLQFRVCALLISMFLEI